MIENSGKSLFWCYFGNDEFLASLPLIVGFTLQIRCFGRCRYARTWGDVRSWICFLATAQGRIFLAPMRVFLAPLRVIFAPMRVNFTPMRVFCAPRREICAQVREIYADK